MDHLTARRHFLSSLGVTSLLATQLSKLDHASSVSAAPPPDPTRPLAPSQADLGTNYDFLAQIADSWRASLIPPGADQRFDQAFRQQARRRVIETLSYDPPRVDMNPQVIERVERDDHVRERVVFSTTPWFRIAGYVLVPKNLRGRAPAIVDLHSHGGMFLFGKEKVIDLGDNHPAMTRYHEQNYDRRPTATELVRRGFVVMSIDAFMFGERRVLLDEDLPSGWDRSKYSLDDVQRLNAKCRGKESTLAKSLVLAGATWPGVVNYDDRRTIDYLATRPDVDPERIGCSGISMGGYRSAYLAALDERIRAACVVGFMSSMRPMLRAHVDTHSWVHFLPGLHRLVDFPELAALAAPRSLFVQQCEQDRLFPLEGMRESVARIEQLYRSADAADQFRGKFYDEPHRWTIPMQDEAFAWLDQQLRGK
ncbi:MAG: alpha/beta hydrolase family protein [Pirellulales bacterium]